MGWIRERIDSEYRKYHPIGLDWSRLAEQKIIGNLKEDLEWCRDWLDVGCSEEEQENQLKVLVKLNEIIDKLDVVEKNHDGGQDDN